MAPKFNRREMLSASVLAGSAVALNSAQARSISGEVPWQEGQANKPDIAQPGTYIFLTAPEAEWLDAALSRLIPKDELGPGAKEAGVTFFLDRQLAGPLWPGVALVHAGAVEKGRGDARLSKPHDAGRTLSRRHQGDRCA